MATLLTCQRLILELTARVTSASPVQRAALCSALACGTAASTPATLTEDDVQNIVGAMVVAAGGTFDTGADTIAFPPAAPGPVAFSALTGVAASNPSLVAYVAAQVDPGVSGEPVGRALTQADNGKTLKYTGAGAANFVVPNTLTAPFVCAVVKWAAGSPTVTSDGTSVIRVATGKSATQAAQYDAVSIELMEVTPTTVRVL